MSLCLMIAFKMIKMNHAYSVFYFHLNLFMRFALICLKRVRISKTSADTNNVFVYKR